MKHFPLALLGLLFSFNLLLAPSARASENIGYVNLQRAIVEVEEGKRAKARLEATFKKKQAALRQKESELEAMKKRIDASGKNQDDPAARQQVVAFQKKFLALRETLLKEQNELKKLEVQALSKITNKLRKVIQEIGRKGGYTMILETQEASLLYAKPHLDLTNEVIRKYNQRHSKGRKKK